MYIYIYSYIYILGSREWFVRVQFYEIPAMQECVPVAFEVSRLMANPFVGTPSGNRKKTIKQVIRLKRIRIDRLLKMKQTQALIFYNFLWFPKEK